MITSDQSGKAVMMPIWRIALRAAKITATQRAHSCTVSSPKPVRTMTTPRMRWIHPQAVKLHTVTPRPPTVTTLGLKIAARPQSRSSVPTIRRTTPAKIVQPRGSGSGPCWVGTDERVERGAPGSVVISNTPHVKFDTKSLGNLLDPTVITKLTWRSKHVVIRTRAPSRSGRATHLATPRLAHTGRSHAMSTRPLGVGASLLCRLLAALGEEEQGRLHALAH